MHFNDGTTIAAWERFELRQRYDDPVGSFSFTASPPDKDRKKYRGLSERGSRVHVFINGAKQATCIITGRKQMIAGDGYAMQIQCKSLLATPYEGHVDPYLAKTFQADTPIVDIVLEVMAPYGFTSIVSDTAAAVEAISGKPIGGRAPAVGVEELKLKDVQSRSGQAAYAFCAALFTRLGLALRLGPDGKMLLGAPDYTQESSYTVVQDRDRSISGDRMLASPPIEISESNDGQFSEVVIIGKSPDRRGAKSAAPPEVGARWDNLTRPSNAPFPDITFKDLETGLPGYRGPFKPLYYQDDKSRDAEYASALATRVITGPRIRNGFQVRHAVDGLVSRSGGRIWAVDTVGRVVVTDVELDQKMWLYETVQRGDKRNGQTTQLTWLPLNALQLGGP